MVLASLVILSFIIFYLYEYCTQNYLSFTNTKIAMLSGLDIEFPCGIHFKYTEMTQANDLTDSSTFHRWIAKGKNKSMTKSDLLI